MFNRLLIAILSTTSAPIMAQTACQPEPLPYLDQTEIDADKAAQTKSGEFDFSGNVKVRQQTQEILAEEIHYSEPAQHLTAQGNVRIRDTQFKAKTKTLDVKNQTLATLTPAEFTRCMKATPDWSVKASDMVLDDEEKVGTAKHARIEFKGVPIFYSPYLTFPLGDQKTGFLMPSYGSKLENDYIQIPYYWAIAPNMDDTLTLTNVSNRGVLLDNEFRYLQPDYQGDITAAWLSDETLNEDRWMGHWIHQHRFNPNWTASLDVQEVSDIEIHRELPLVEQTTDQNQLYRHAHLNYASAGHSFNINLHDYKPLTLSDGGYQRLPEINDRLSGQVDANTHWALNTQWVDFQHRDADKIQGNRTTVNPNFTWRNHKIYGRTQLQTGAYLNEYDVTANTDTQQTLYFNAQQSLIFDRNIATQSGDWLHTLEPKASYIYADARNQNTLNFDSTAIAISLLSQLHQPRLYTGLDTYQSQNRVAMTLESNLFTPEGNRLINIGIGRNIHIDEDLNYSTAHVRQLEAWLTQASIEYGPMRLNYLNRWDDQLSEIQYHEANLWFNAAEAQQYAQLRWTKDEQTLQEEFSGGLVLPIGNTGFKVAHYETHDVDSGQRTESLSSVEYSSCCWAINTYYEERWLNNVTQRTFNIQFTLKELTSLGQGGDARLRERLTGYTY